MAAVLAIDLGGSALKACLFDAAGAVVASASQPLAFEEAQGRSEQQPVVWWQALLAAAETLAAEAPEAFGTVGALAVCGFTRTQVLLDAALEVLRPAIGFRDSRAQEAAEAARALPAVAAHPEARNLNAFHPLARLLWLQRQEPAVWEDARLLLEPKDYLNLRLTGVACSDPISQHWLALATAGGSESLAAAAGLSHDPLPRLIPPTATVGQILPDLPAPLDRIAGARVFCGSNDTWAAAAGLGALQPGRAYCISGSSEVFGLMSPAEVAAEGLITLPWGEGIWHVGGPGLNGANALTWIVERLAPGPQLFARRLEALLQQPAAPQPLLFHPYLLGERTPFWDRDLRASFLGLGAGHGPGDLVRAVMEGVSFVNRLVLERAEAAAGCRAEAIRIAGGGSRSPAWNSLRASSLGRSLLVSDQAEMGLAGCRAVARVGLGEAPDLASAIAAGSLREVRPDRSEQPRLDALYQLFLDTQPALAEASHRLVGIGAAHPPRVAS